MTAGHDKDGHDEAALMAVITGETPGDDALADDVFMTAYRSAADDVALLREQLGLIGRALADPERAAVSERAADSVPAADSERVDDPEPGRGTGASVPSLSARRTRTRSRPLAVALRGLVAAVGAGLVIGMGWLVVQSDGLTAGDDQGGSSAADSSAGRPQAGEDAKLGHAGYLACARIVVEGTVAGVETLPGTGQDRITLDVARYYKPDKGGKRITFPMETGVEPRLRAGDHVLVGIPGGQAEPDMWTTGEKEIARDRAWITEALPASRTFPCP
ncbi:hypothetical protein QFZ55_002874 [Streptomyces luteogriseus]|uniref:hypothetical protein n=1 Tax=Streptomyces luteogriseus TaxID=68233 RepID=UPI0027830BF2|nr:hypothetical protein [Streptomyces luteogriseus]MDQ0713422.1 hypothetical protein [Streptomyces luteogriseus]